MTTQIFTFGVGQRHEGKYIKIFGTSKGDCRKRMFEIFGQKWASQYNNERQAGVKEYDLKEFLS